MEKRVPESSEGRDDRGLESDTSAKFFSAKGRTGEEDFDDEMLGIPEYLGAPRLNETCRACFGL